MAGEQAPERRQERAQDQGDQQQECDIAKAAEVYRRTLGAHVSEAAPQPEHGVTTVFITLPNTKIELIAPLGDASPIAKFLERNPDGGIHHVCYEVEDIRAARDSLKAQGARVLGEAPPASFDAIEAELDRRTGMLNPAKQ